MQLTPRAARADYSGGALSRLSSVVLDAMPGKDLCQRLVVALHLREGQLVAVVHDLVARRNRHGPLEKEQGLVRARFKEQDVDFGVRLPVVVESQEQFFAAFDSFGLLPGEEDAEFVDLRTLAVGERGQAGDLRIVAEGDPGIDQHDQAGAVVNGDIDMRDPS